MCLLVQVVGGGEDSSIESNQLYPETNENKNENDNLAWKSPVQNHVSEYPLSCVQYPRSLSDFILLLFVVVPRWKMAGMSLGDGKREGVEHWLTLFKC